MVCKPGLGMIPSLPSEAKTFSTQLIHVQKEKMLRLCCCQPVAEYKPEWLMLFESLDG